MPSVAENILNSAVRKARTISRDIHDASKIINDIFFWAFISPLKGKPLRFRASISVSNVPVVRPALPDARVATGPRNSMGTCAISSRKLKKDRIPFMSWKKK